MAGEAGTIEGGGGGASADGGAGDAKMYTQEEVDRLIAQNEQGLKANRDEALREVKAARKALQGFDGVDPKEYKRLKDAEAEAERKRAEAEGDFQSLEQQLIERHQQELAAKDIVVEKYRAAMNKRLVQAELTKAITAHKGDADLLLPHAERFVRVRETDDDFEAYVVDERGNAVVSDGQGTPANFDDLVKENLMAKYPRAFDGVGSSGGGASRSTVGDRGAVGVISADDPDAFLANVADIASGKTAVK